MKREYLREIGELRQDRQDFSLSQRNCKSAPSCTSGWKYYYGIKENFKELIDNLEDRECE